VKKSERDSAKLEEKVSACRGRFFHNIAIREERLPRVPSWINVRAHERAGASRFIVEMDVRIRALDSSCGTLAFRFTNTAAVSEGNGNAVACRAIAIP
jgi:hypothetical protein